MSFATAPTVSIIIPVFNKWAYTFNCLMAVASHTRDVSHEVIVVDNASTDDTAQALPRLDNLRFLRNDRNLGFAKACNQGAAMARGSYLMFLNNDTEVRAAWLSSMVEILDAEPEVAMVGSKLLFPDGTLQHGGVVFGYAAPLPVTPFHLHYRHPATASQERLSLRAVTAACMLVRGEVFRAVGTFDEGFINGYEDVDLCLKVSQTGAKIIYTPASVAVHHESVSEGRFAADPINTNRLNQRWQGSLQDFDVDFRREVRPPHIDAQRPGASVIVPMRDALWSIAPCLENLRYTTGDQDEIILIDDGSVGPARDFARQFVAKYPRRFRLIRNEHAAGLPQAALQGLEIATRSRAVVMAPSLRVVGDWLERLPAHLRANPHLGAIVPTLQPVEGLPMHHLLYPLDVGVPTGTGTVVSGVAHPRPASPGDVEEIAIPVARMIYADRERLLEIGRRAPQILLGDDQGRLATELRAQGLSLGRARDVGVYRLTQIPGDVDAGSEQRYAAQSSANLTYDRGYRDAGGPLIGQLTAAQTQLTSIVIVARDNLAVTADCLASIYAHTHRSFEVVLVDNGSTEDFQGLVARIGASHGNITWLRNQRDVGYASACNQGLAAARGEYLAILHNDVLVTPGWLSRQLALMAIDPAVGVTGPALSACANAQSVGMRTYQSVAELTAFAEAWAVNHANEIALSVPLSGVCLVMKRQVVARIGGLDGSFGSSIHTDDDFCLRAFRAGYRLAIAFDAFVHHQGAATWKRLGIDRGRVAAESWRLFCEKWGLPADAKLLPAVRALADQPFDPARDRIPLAADSTAHGSDSVPAASTTLAPTAAGVRANWR
jgi:GT2 family glycosyltransferase